MYEIIFTESYDKRARKFLRRYPEIKNQYEKCLKLLEINPYHPSLRLHRLKGRMTCFFSVSINIKYRIIIDFIIQDDLIIPVDVGSHEDIYIE